MHKIWILILAVAVHNSKGMPSFISKMNCFENTATVNKQYYH